MAAKDYKKGAIPYTFIALPKDVLRSEEFGLMSPSAKSLMLDLASQYTGKNNGRLCASLEALKPAGWTSRHTLMRARDALLKCTFTLCTRKGHPPRTAEWFGFTWWKLDWHESMDVSPSGWPYLNFVQTPALKPAKPTREDLYARHRKPEATANPVVPKQHHNPTESAPGGAETAPRDRASEPPVVPKQHHATEVNAENGRGAETAQGIEITISGARAGALPGLPARGPAREKRAAPRLRSAPRGTQA